MTVIEQDYIKLLPTDQSTSNPGNSNKGMSEQFETDPTIVSKLIKRSQTSIEQLKQNIQAKSGLDLFDFILEDIEQLKKILFDPQSTAVFMAAINATTWINENMNEWLGEKTQQIRFLYLYRIILLRKWVWR